MQTYRHFSTVTSQLYFCSSPIRLDSYNRCQFGCLYCFSRKRGLANAVDGLKQANPLAFRQRLERVNRGVIRSGFDEFLAQRIPIQLGGMQDPFSPMEIDRRVTLELMSILADFNYPTLISTKGSLLLEPKYISKLQEMNVLVRLSAAGVSEKYRSSVDVGCSPFEETLRKITALRYAGLPCSLRIQPVIPGFENSALEMASRAVAAGVSHISFEYLKLGTESLKKDTTRLARAVNTNVWRKMKAKGVTRLGRDYTLTKQSKSDFVFKAKKECKALKVYFGAGDTEFIHLSDGNGCCNGSSLFLKNSKQFLSNYVGAVSDKKFGDLIFFDHLKKQWYPKGNIHHYLTTNSRARIKSNIYPSWLALIAYRWNGDTSPYSPDFFWGVEWTRKFDNKGFKIYQYNG